MATTTTTTQAINKHSNDLIRFEFAFGKIHINLFLRICEICTQFCCNILWQISLPPLRIVPLQCHSSCATHTFNYSHQHLISLIALALLRQLAFIAHGVAASSAFPEIIKPTPNGLPLWQFLYSA